MKTGLRNASDTFRAIKQLDPVLYCKLHHIFTIIHAGIGWDIEDIEIK